MFLLIDVTTGLPLEGHQYKHTEIHQAQSHILNKFVRECNIYAGFTIATESMLEQTVF